MGPLVFFVMSVIWPKGDRGVALGVCYWLGGYMMAWLRVTWDHPVAQASAFGYLVLGPALLLWAVHRRWERKPWWHRGVLWVLLVALGVFLNWLLAFLVFTFS